jgi:hypothetical protein
MLASERLHDAFVHQRPVAIENLAQVIGVPFYGRELRIYLVPESDERFAVSVTELATTFGGRVPGRVEENQALQVGGSLGGL